MKRCYSWATASRSQSLPCGSSSCSNTSRLSTSRISSIPAWTKTSQTTRLFKSLSVNSLVFSLRSLSLFPFVILARCTTTYARHVFKATDTLSYPCPVCYSIAVILPSRQQVSTLLIDTCRSTLEPRPLRRLIIIFPYVALDLASAS
jgi:hypothetical protein